MLVVYQIVLVHKSFLDVHLLAWSTPSFQNCLECVVHAELILEELCVEAASTMSRAGCLLGKVKQLSGLWLCSCSPVINSMA